MTILFPTKEAIGLQAARVLDSVEGEFYTLVTTNNKGGIISVQSLSEEEVKSINIDVVVLPKETTNYKSANIYIDENSPNVDTALVKVMREKLFNKTA